MAEQDLIAKENPVAQRQNKTDRLFLARLVRDAGEDNRLDEAAVAAAHEIVLKWVELDKKGRLKKKSERQLEGEFFADLFDKVLGYPGVATDATKWNLEQQYNLSGQFPDAVLGNFGEELEPEPKAVLELKGPRVHLDRDRAGGRTAVDQCWDYLVNMPSGCRWGIVTNMVSFRLYERGSTKRAYEHFSLQSLASLAVFRQFYAIFRYNGLVKGIAKEEPKALQLLKSTQNRQREVSDKLYDAYSKHRLDFVAHLHHDLKHSIEDSIEYAQRLLDRVVFIAFCEDRGLLPKETIKRAYENLPAFSAITNPRWQNFKTLFRFVDEGQPTTIHTNGGQIPAYNGGLFKQSPADELELDDRWTEFFRFVGEFDFADEVNLDVLGHLFERSITELEKLKTTGLFGDAEKSERYAQMPQSAKRKQLGVYYTPAELTSRIVLYTVDELIEERFRDLAIEQGTSKKKADLGKTPDTPDYWNGCLAILRDLRVVDPACGSGAFLFQAYNTLESRYFEVLEHLTQLGNKKAKEQAVVQQALVPQWILEDNLYGVDLSPEAVEITQLALWIRSATPGQTLAKLSENIVHGNSLVHDAEVHPAGFDWRERFAHVFDREQQGFDCVIGNPPWERIKLQEREFFSLPAPEIATATNAAKRRKLVATLESEDPALYERYEQAQEAAASLLTYCRKSDQYPLTGKG
ncbi:MAG: N-6 DNA methylase, partial [Lacipirellulaceae bacterium]